MVAEVDSGTNKKNLKIKIKIIKNKKQQAQGTQKLGGEDVQIICSKFFSNFYFFQYRYFETNWDCLSNGLSWSVRRVRHKDALTR